MSAAERFNLLQSSVDIIRFTNMIGQEPTADQWHWYFSHWTQWHSIAIVITELGWLKNKHFANNAWNVLDPILESWDKVYRVKRDEPAWDHVNALIERARQVRQRSPDRQLISTSSQNSVLHEKTLGPQTVDQLVNSRMDQQAPVLETSMWFGIDQSAKTMQSMPDLDWNTQLPPTQLHLDPAYHSGCANTALDFETDFGSFADLDSIDFSAFDAVFGDASWDASSLSTELSVGNFNA